MFSYVKDNIVAHITITDNIWYCINEYEHVHACVRARLFISKAQLTLTETNTARAFTRVSL